MEHEGSVADDASGVASRVRRSGQLEQLDVEVAIHGMAQQPAQRMRTAGVGRLQCLAVAVEDGSPGDGVAFSRPRLGQIVAQVG